MKIHDLALIGADTARTRAYIQCLAQRNYMINKCYFMTDDPEAMERSANEYKEDCEIQPYFDRDQPPLFTLKKAGISYEFISTTNINSDICLETIRHIQESNLIYSGYGGQIIKEPFFQLGKTFVHVHSGILPQYRGSTTVYYSLLQEGQCGASAIVMTPGLDAGDVIAEEKFPMPPQGVDIDYIYDPYIRARVLVKAIDVYLEKGSFNGRAQGGKGARTYFIAHPLLRHIVKLEQDIEKEGENK